MRGGRKPGLRAESDQVPGTPGAHWLCVSSPFAGSTETTPIGGLFGRGLAVPIRASPSWRSQSKLSFPLQGVSSESVSEICVGMRCIALNPNPKRRERPRREPTYLGESCEGGGSLCTVAVPPQSLV